MLCIRVRNFLPQPYIEKQNNAKGKSIKRVIYYLLIFNISILPLNVNSNSVNIEQEIDSYNFEDEYHDVYEDLLKWLYIDINIIKSIKVGDKSGEVIIHKKEDAYYLESLGFTIDEVKHIEDDILVKIRSGGGGIY